MQFSVGVENALHSVFYLVDLPPHKTVAIKEIARLNGITETYLSKVFSKLRRAGIVRSVPGASGGYELARPAEDISFWDVVEALEGPSYMFRCAEIRQQSIFEADLPGPASSCPCLIKVVMHSAEDAMRDELKSKSLRWLHDNVHADFSEKKKAAIAAWSRGV